LRKAFKILFRLPLTSFDPLPYGTLDIKKPQLRGLKPRYEMIILTLGLYAQREGGRETGNTHPRAAPSRP